MCADPAVMVARLVEAVRRLEAENARLRTENARLKASIAGGSMR